MFVKVCGATSEEDALLAVAMDADAIGFVLAPSPRQISPALVADIVKRLPPEIITIGVFRNESPARIVEVVNKVGLKGAQLHGQETPQQARWVRHRVPVVIQAFSAGDAAIAAHATTAPMRCSSTLPRPARARCSTGPWRRAPPTASA